MLLLASDGRTDEKQIAAPEEGGGGHSGGGDTGSHPGAGKVRGAGMLTGSNW